MVIKFNPKIMLKQFLVHVCLFLIFLFPYNESLFQLIYPKSVFCPISILFGLVGLALVKGKKMFSKSNLLLFTITTFIATLLLVNNYHVKEGNELKAIIYTLYLFLPFVVANNDDIKKPFYNVILLFSIEHIIGTFIGLFFKDYYKSVILPFVCTGRTICTAIGNNYHGYMTGFTTHFSTNAIYLSIASMLFFSKLINEKNKKNLVLFIISIIGLFTAGKRAHLIFTIFSCICLYIFKNSKNQIKKYTKLIVVFVISIVMFVFMSKYIPELSNIITRFENLIDSGDVMNGRETLYSLAFKLFDKHMFFGNGWGSFSYYYQMELYTYGQLSYLNAHNVFIQLLCEVGIFGFMIFTMIFITSFVKTYIILKAEKDVWLIDFSFMYQLFFLLYCFTGNPLYDSPCYVLYFFVIGFIILKEKGNNIYEKNRDNNIL